MSHFFWPFLCDAHRLFSHCCVLNQDSWCMSRCVSLCVSWYVPSLREVLSVGSLCVTHRAATGQCPAGTHFLNFSLLVAFQWELAINKPSQQLLLSVTYWVSSEIAWKSKIFLLFITPLDTIHWILSNRSDDQAVLLANSLFVCCPKPNNEHWSFNSILNTATAH